MDNKTRVWIKFVLGLISSASAYIVGNAATIHSDLKPHEKVLLFAGLIGGLTTYALAFLDKSYASTDVVIGVEEKAALVQQLVVHGFNEESAQKLVDRDYNAAKKMLSIATE